MRKLLVSIWEIVEVVLISLAAVFVIRTFIAQPFLVSGASMEPNFQDGNYLIIDELTYRFREPERGDVIVFRFPKDTKTFFIKRILGLPGERVVVDNGTIEVSRDGESVYREGGTSGAYKGVLKTGQYFVVGDNRYNSFDSRSWGPIEKKHIIGLARLRVLPLTELEIIEHGENY